MTAAAGLSRDLLELGIAVGLLTGEPPDVELDESWFSDPGGRLARALSHPGQRAAILRLASRVLGSAGPDELDLRDLPEGETWLPIAAARSPRAGLFAIVATEPGGEVLLSLGGRLASDDLLAGRELESAATVAVPLVRLRPDAAAELLVGSPAGTLRVGVSVSAPDGLAGDAGLELSGVSLDVAIPTDGRDPTLAVALSGLRLPGEIAARDRSIADPEALGRESLDLLAGLLRAQAGSASGELRHLLALLGVTPAAGMPPLALGDVLQRGVPALADWARTLAGSPASLRVWLGELSGLLGGGAVTGSGSDDDPFSVDLTSIPSGRLLLRVGRDPATGTAVVRPAVALSRDAAPGASVAGGASAEVELAAVALGPVVSAVALPGMVAALRLGTGAPPLVDATLPVGTRLVIGHARAGVALDSQRRVMPLLELRDVRVDAVTYPVLDLSSADAVREAAAGALEAVADALLDALASAPEGRAIAALAGMARPAGVGDGDPWPSLVSLPQVFADPLREVGCYHARVLDRPGGWRELAAELATLLRTTGVSASAPSGDGTPEIPWTSPVFHDPGVGTVELLAWTVDEDERRVLHIGAAIRPRAASVGDGALTVALVSEALRVSFPSRGCAPPFPAVLVGEHTLTARLGDDLSFGAGAVALSCDSIEASARWSGTSGLRRAFAIAGASVRVDGVEHPLPRVALPFGSGDPRLALASLPWDALEALAGRALATLGPWSATVARAVGWTPAPGDLDVTVPRLPGLELSLPPGRLPRLSLRMLASDPAGALREWLAAMLGGDGAPELPLVLAGWLGALLPAGVEPDADALTAAVSGSGTDADPWAIRVAAGTGVPELLLWLDPDGPALAAVPGLVEQVAPAEPAGGVERLLELLEQAAGLVPELAGMLAGRAGLLGGLTALRAGLAGSDGLVPAAAQSPGAPWASIDGAAVAHLAQPAAFDAERDLPTGAPGPARRVFLVAALAGAAPWPDQAAAHVVDLTAAGLAPEAFDLTGLPAAGPYAVLLPARSAAGGLDGVVARLRRALQAIRAAAGGPLCVIAHSTAGVPARILAAEPGISHLVTVGTPHGGAALPWAAEPSTADAARVLQLLRGLAGPDPAPADELMATLAAALSGGVPAGDFAAAPFPPLHDEVAEARAIVAALDDDELDEVLADTVRRSLAAAGGLLPGWEGRPATHAGAGLRARLPLPAAGGGAVSVDASVRIDLGRLELRPGRPARTSRARLRLELRRDGGWLAGGPASDPRVRWAEIELSVGLDDPPGTAARIVLHEAAVFGLGRDRWVIDEGLVTPGGDHSGTLVPEARVLLGEIARALGTPAPGSPTRRLADLLSALGLARIAADGSISVLTDPLERMLVDPASELRARLSGDRAALLDALARWLGGPPPVGDELTFGLGDGLLLSIAAGDAPALAVWTSAEGMRVGDGIDLDGRLTLTPGGRVTGDLAATRGTLGLRATFDTGAGDVLALHLDPPGESDPIELLPAPDAGRLARAAGMLLAGELARLVLEWADREAPLQTGPVLAALGLRGSVRNPAPLLADPAGWLAGALPPRPDGRPGIGRAALAVLVDAAAAVVSPGSPAGTLALPWGLRLTAGGEGGDALATLGWAAPVPAGNALLDGSLRVRLGPGFAVTPGLDASAQVTGLAGLERVGLTLSVDGGVEAALRVRRSSGGAEIVVGLLPAAGGLGPLAGLAPGAAVDALLPLALDALAAHAQIGPPVSAAGDALGLRPSGTSFDAAQLRTLADDPAGGLAVRLSARPAEALDAAAALAATVLPAGTVTRETRPGTGIPFLRAALSPGVVATLDVPGAGPPMLCLEAVDAHPIPALTVSGRACASSAGFTGLRASVEVDDPALLRLGAASALPFAALLVEGSDARLEAGIWTGPASAPGRRALVAVVPLGGGDTTLVCRSADGGPDDPDLRACFAGAVRVWLVPLAVELLTAVDAVVERLERPLPFAGTAPTTLGSLLADAQLLTRSAGPRYDVAPGALDPANLAARVPAIAAQAVRRIGEGWGGPAALAPVTVRLASDDHAGRTVFGVRLGLREPLRLLSAGGVELYLEAVAAPELSGAGAEPGIELLLVSLPGGSFDPAGLELRPWIKLAGVGLRAAGEQGGRLIDLVASIDAVGVHAVYERNAAEPAGGDVARAGGRILLVNLGVPLGAAGGGNPVAQKLLGGGAQPTRGDEQPLRPAFSPQLTIVRAAPAGTVVSFRAGEGDGPWWLPVQRRFGPLYVEQVGLDTDELPGGDIDRVRLLLDGGVSLAGLAVQVDDLSLSIPFRAPFALDEWRLDLAGLAVGYRGGAIEIAGGLRKRSGAPPDYVGMLLVRAGQFGLTAIGGYAELPVAPGSAETYTSLFVFAALSFPLGGPPAFFVTGLGGGVGLNRRLVVPGDVGDLPAFPLVAAMDPSSAFAADPMGALDGIGASFPPERGRFWLAAGVRFTSFALVEGLAVLSVELGDGIEVNLLGLGRMSLPTPQLAISRIEVALRARFSSREMVLSVQGQLTDNSYVLHPACRLTGGFAMATWFETGQFVLTLGGYHPRFARPPEFPVVPRLGFTWLVSPIIAVKGEAYLALTSTCVMAGGRLEAAYRTDVVWASFTAGIDAIVSWDPFFYDVSVYVRVSAGVDIRIWTPFGRVRVRFSTSIGADLRVWGPELRGQARLDLDVISVTVRFGGSGEPAGASPIGWNEFHEKYLVAGDPEGLAMSATVLAGQLAPDPGAGRAAADTGRLDSPWRVQPEFVVQSATRAASNRVNGRSLDALTPQAIDLGPMHQVGVVSSHTVVVRERRTGTDVTARLTVEPVVGNVPEGIWRRLGPQPAAEANVRPAFLGARLAAPAVVPAAEGFARLRQVEVSEVPLPLPFHDEIAQRDDFTADVEAAGRYVAAQPAQAGAILARAAEKLSGVGALELRAFAADRVAPPRLAPLAEGMVDPLKPPVGKQPVPEAPAAPVPSDAVVKPRLHALLRAPGRAAPRTSVRTTVSPDRARVPRRSVPTLAGARALAASLGAARLELADPPPAASGRTIRPRDGGPPTARAGGLTEVRRGYAATEPAARSLRRLEAMLHDGGAVPLTAGDVHVWELPNAHMDAGRRRPRIVVEGDQLVRLVALDRAGEVLADATGSSHRLGLPQGTARLAASGLGSAGKEGQGPAGLAGWHAASALRQVDDCSYLGPRCVVLATSPATVRGRRPVSAAIVRAAQAVFGHAAVTTRLPAGTRTLLVALETAEQPDEALAGLVLGLEGAVRGGGEARIVVSGTRAHGIFSLEPDPGAPAVEVTISSEERWRLAAVAGGELPAGEAVSQLTAHGLEAMVGDEMGSATGTSELRWSEED